MGQAPAIEPSRPATRLSVAVRRFAADDSGATAIEYGILTLIAIAIMAVVSQIGGSAGGMFDMLKGAFN